jgi:hypothetical protein
MQAQMEDRTGIIEAGPAGSSVTLRRSDFGIISVIFDESPGIVKKGFNTGLSLRVSSRFHRHSFGGWNNG